MAKSVYQVITDRVLKQLEEGVVPWKKSWFGKAISYASGKLYRGANVLWLTAPGEYITYSQVKANKGEILKGAEAFPVVFKKKETEEYEDAKGVMQDKEHWITRYYKVYHVSSTTVEPRHTKHLDNKNTPIERAEDLINAYLAEEGLYVKAGMPSYYPEDDKLGMPEIKFYEQPEDYYHDMFHEMGHSTSHPSRLNRSTHDNTNMSSKGYALEELIAELTSAMIMSHLGIDLEKVRQANASYIRGWIDAMKADVTIVSRAGLMAQKASEYILSSLEVA